VADGEPEYRKILLRHVCRRQCHACRMECHSVKARWTTNTRQAEQQWLRSTGISTRPRPTRQAAPGRRRRVVCRASGRARAKLGESAGLERRLTSHMPAQTEGIVLVPRAELEALCQPTPVIQLPPAPKMQRFPILTPSAARLGDPRLRPAHAAVRTRAACSGCIKCCVGSPGGFSAGAGGDDVGGHWRTVQMLPARTLAC
jgi:hypothetical protein